IRPIQTYGLQGVLKHGVHSEDHAVVYSSRRDGPFLLDREEGLMMKRPIRIEIRDPSHKLDPLSRLNYAKTYTVEHNVKVLFIGKVAECYEQKVITSFNETHPPVASYSGESGSPGVFSRNAKYNTDHPYRNATPVPGAQPYGLSTFSQSSRATSVDGADDVDSGAQRLCDFLSTQDWLLKLSKEASEKVSIDKFENNLRRSLKQFAVDLKKEGATTIMVETGSAIARIARNAANLFRQSLERLTKSDQEADRIDTKGDQVNWPSGDYREEDPDEDDMDDVLDYKEGEGEDDPKSLEILLAKSVALQLLEENLRLFISPDPIRRMFFEMWPVTRSRTSQFTVEYDVQWEVPSFFGTYFAEGEELGNVLTVTGEAINAQAQSCRDYLVQTWPKIGATLLDCLHELLVHGSDGLEISFADMAMLSHSVSFTEHDGGLIVEGLRTVLIPMEIISQDEPDEAIQWHLEYKRQLKDPELRSLSEIFATVPGSKWYKSHDPNELFRKRCFLGWAEEVAVMIGTEQFSASEVFPSKAKQTSKTCRVDKSHAISIGLTGVGINLNAGKAWQKAARPSTIAWDRCKGIRDTLSDEHRYSLLIYDTNQQIGWLLPRLSVILYMAHKIFTSREQTGHRLLSGGKETYFRHAKPNADGASAAFSALDELMSLEVRK
ncbi:hypothetical protein BGZ57DRAFT_725703, partial [Hyaloscypha finlandica]